MGRVDVPMPKTPLPYLWYLDDIWGIWPLSQEEFNEYFQVPNGHHASIKVKQMVHPTSMTFLDMTTFKEVCPEGGT